MKSEAFPTPSRCGMVLGTVGSHPGVFENLEEFMAVHRACDTLKGGADAPTPNGYLLSISCSCGAVFQRWVTPEAEEADLLYSSLINFSN